MSKASGDQDVDVKQIENVGALISVALVKEARQTGAATISSRFVFCSPDHACVEQVNL
jgi:hypothetical protein